MKKILIGTKNIKNILDNYEKQYGLLGFYNVREILSNLFSIILESRSELIYYNEKFFKDLDLNKHPNLNTICIDIMIKLKSLLLELDRTKKYYLCELNKNYSNMILFELNE